MAVDPTDLLEPPFCFGRCTEYSAFIYPECQAWESGTNIATVHIRREGNFVRILLPEIFVVSNGEGRKDIIQFNLDMLNDEQKEKVLGKYPKSMRYLCGGMNGVVSDEEGSTHEICFCTIDMDFKGNFYIAPEEDDEGFCTYANTNPIGIFSFSLVYEVSDEPEQMEDDEENKEEGDEGDEDYDLSKRDETQTEDDFKDVVADDSIVDIPEIGEKIDGENEIQTQSEDYAEEPSLKEIKLE